jgi:beta-lactamase regulating signal transducer with metallopeptidase domain
MNGIVEQLLKMSLTASVVILVVLIIRQLMRRFPRRYVYLLWTVVWFRLLCPISVGSRFSIFNIKRAADRVSEAQITAAPAAHAGREAVRRRAIAEAYRRVAVNAPRETKAVTPQASGIDPHVLMLSIWMIVAAAILGYAIFHFIRLKIRLRDAKEVDRRIYESPLVESPFVMGILRPSIYVPTELGEDEAAYLIEHERAHIRRGDLLFKTIAVVSVAVHWFNPLVWLSFVLFCRDMEMGCDEMVLTKLGEGIRKDYSLSLITLARRNDDHTYVVMPVAFGKSPAGISEVKMRIENIMNFKKSSALIAAVAGVSVACVGAACGFNAYAEEEPEELDVVQTEETAEASSGETVSEETVSEETTETEAPEETVPADVAASQELYMVARPDFGDADFGQYCYDDYCIEDMSVIEDGKLRELAEQYYAQGFFINNPEITAIEGCGPGDEDLVFAYGFHADSGDPCDEYVYWEFDAYLMDETLFNYYFIEGNFLNQYVTDGEFDEITDDGTVICAVDHIENFDYRVEFNRDTGIAMISMIKLEFSEDDFGGGQEAIVPIDDMSVIENSDIREIAQGLYDEGYVISRGDMGFGIGTEEISAVWQDGSTCINVEIYEADDRLFDDMCSEYGEFDPDVVIEDDGSVATITMNFDEDNSQQYTYYRDTGVMIWTFTFTY